MRYSNTELYFKNKYPMNDQDIYLPEVLFEFVQQGNYVKVMAVDPNTGIEIAMVGDRRSGRNTLERLAIQKLKYVIRKKAKEQGHS